MIEQRHPTERVTPVEVGDPIKWAEAGADTRALYGRTSSRGSYRVAPCDEVWVAQSIGQVLGHGGAREHVTNLKYCTTAEAAQRACQDAEHVHAWATLSDTARALLLERYAVAVAA